MRNTKRDAIIEELNIYQALYEDRYILTEEYNNFNSGLYQDTIDITNIIDKVEDKLMYVIGRGTEGDNTLEAIISPTKDNSFFNDDTLIINESKNELIDKGVGNDWKFDILDIDGIKEKLESCLDTEYHEVFNIIERNISNEEFEKINKENPSVVGFFEKFNKEYKDNDIKKKIFKEIKDYSYLYETKEELDKLDNYIIVNTKSYGYSQGDRKDLTFIFEKDSITDNEIKKLEHIYNNIETMGEFFLTIKDTTTDETYMTDAYLNFNGSSIYNKKILNKEDIKNKRFKSELENKINEIESEWEQERIIKDLENKINKLKKLKNK